MNSVMETTVHDMKTHFSSYASNLVEGVYDEIIVKNRTKPWLRILRYEEPKRNGLVFGIARERGHRVVSDDWDINDGDEEIGQMFEEMM